MPDSPSRAFTLLLAYAGEQTTISAQTPFTIGRAPEMDLVLPYPFISRRQAEIRFDDSTTRYFCARRSITWNSLRAPALPSWES
jgi:pSer/pThr/pTyr-binding forkhead associated (FHA) protein